MSTGIAISGTGIWHPKYSIDNDELCAAFNEWVRRENERNADAIAAGDQQALEPSSAEFIKKVSGIERRYAYTKDGILDPDRMVPIIPDRPDDEMSLMCEFVMEPGKAAIEAAGRCPEEIDLTILASAMVQRMYPCVAIEAQHHLGTVGYAHDMTVGCSSATYAIHTAANALRAGTAKRALILNPEISCGHLNYRDRDSHFIFGDAATALVLERTEDVKTDDAWEIVSTSLFSKFSSNIRNNGGFLNRCDPEHAGDPDKLFYQHGRRVFKDIVPLASQFIGEQVQAAGLKPDDLSRLWLHQANVGMNSLIAKRLLARDPEPGDAPIVLDEWGNTASCGSVIAFHNHRADLAAGSHGIICSFGTGYCIGSILVKRM